MHRAFVPVEMTPPSLGFPFSYYKYTKKANYFRESFTEEKEKKGKTQENEKKGETAACSPLARTAKKDSMKLTFFFLSSLG